LNARNQRKINMKIFTPDKDAKLPVVGGGIVIPKQPFVCFDALENIMKKQGVADSYKIEKIDGKDLKEEDVSGKVVLLMREGGYGDLLWIARMAKLLKEQNPEFKLWVSTKKRHQMVFKGNPYVDKVLDYPLPKTDFDKVDIPVFFKGLIEHDTTGTNVYSLYAEKLGVEIKDEERIPYYTIQTYMVKKLRKWMKKKTKNNGYLNVMLQMGSSSPWKSWHYNHCIELAATLGANRINVYLVGSQRNWMYDTRSRLPNVYQLCKKRVGMDKYTDYWGMEHTVALMKSMDLFIGPDSGLGHFAAAINIPAISIYGPFPANAYVKEYPLTTVIEPDKKVCKLMPCFPHGHKPCVRMDKLGYSPCLNSITSKQVLRYVAEILKINKELRPVTVSYDKG